MRHLLLILIMTLLINGCAHKRIYQVDGMILPDNVIRAKTFNLNLIINYNMVKIFDIKEDDESYETFEYLSLTSAQIHKIKNPKKLVLNINVFNPRKEDYKIIKYLFKEGGGLEGEVLYSGNISRNSFSIELPLDLNKFFSFYYDACDKNDNLVFRSFKAEYIIEK